MPKRTPGHHPNKPPVPTLLPAITQALMDAARRFHKLAPWTWMHDSQLVGLRDPVTDEPLLCSILGRQRTVFALLVYRRTSGRRWILNTIMNDDEPDGFEDGDSALEQDCVKLEFVAKRELTSEDRALLDTARFTPVVPRGAVWPVVRSLVPGGYPWYPTQAEVELLLHALPRAAAFAALCRATPDLNVDLATGEVAFLPADFDPAQRELRTEDLDWQPQIPPPEAPLEPVRLEVELLEQLARLPQAANFRLELDVFYAPMAVGGVERPYFPKAVMAVDRETGIIGGFQLAALDDAQGAAALGQAIASMLQQRTQRPLALHVQRPRVGAMLADLARKLAIPIRLETELAVLNEARTAVARMIPG
jgi:hypothetical protein